MAATWEYMALRLRRCSDYDRRRGSLEYYISSLIYTPDGVGSQPTRIEYEHLLGTIVEKLNELGNQGWEVFQVEIDAGFEGGGWDGKTYWLKRPV